MFHVIWYDLANLSWYTSLLDKLALEVLVDYYYCVRWFTGNWFYLVKDNLQIKKAKERGREQISAFAIDKWLSDNFGLVWNMPPNLNALGDIITWVFSLIYVLVSRVL